MDWAGLHADKTAWMNKHYTPGRASKINKVVVHHNAGVNMTTEDCWRTWQTRQASAHYQVETDGTIGQLVHDQDTAWHATGANASGIGIEHANTSGAPSWGISDATVEAGAHLVAALCHAYGLGRPAWRVNVYPHADFNSTACPGLLAGPLRERYMARAQAWYDHMTGAAPAPATSPHTRTDTREDTTMRIIHTTTPWGDDAWAEITEGDGADGLDRLACAIEQKVWGAPAEVTWDEYNWHITRAWQRFGRRTQATADEIEARIKATIPTQDGAA